ncbi:MAG: DUF4388 domain-containing protein [Chloroflexota bacterium]
MPLVGDSNRMPINRLLQILGSQRRSGLLTVRSGRDTLQAYIHCGRLESGQLTREVAPPEALADSKLPPEDRESAERMARGGEMGTVLLLDFLGLSSQQESLADLRERALAALERAAGWKKAEFRFEAGVEAPSQMIGLNVPVWRVADRLRKAV